MGTPITILRGENHLSPDTTCVSAPLKLSKSPNTISHLSRLGIDMGYFIVELWRFISDE